MFPRMYINITIVWKSARDALALKILMWLAFAKIILCASSSDLQIKNP